MRPVINRHFVKTKLIFPTLFSIVIILQGNFICIYLWPTDDSYKHIHKHKVFER